MDPTVRAIIAGASGRSAVEAFRGLYRLAELHHAVAPVWADVDMLLLPTSPTTATVEAMRADPVRLNSRFGLYTNFANLMGYAAVAVPAGFVPSGLPAGVMLAGPGFSDEALTAMADALHRAADCGMGHDRSAALPPPPAPTLPEGMIPLAVVGAHLSGMPLNDELTAPGGILLGEARTAPGYRLYALTGTVPPKPGMVLDPDHDGPGIAVEVWALPPAAFGAFAGRIPAPLGLGKVRLDNGREVTGFLCEGRAVAGAEEITAFGGWRAWRASVAG